MDVITYTVLNKSLNINKKPQKYILKAFKILLKYY